MPTPAQSTRPSSAVCRLAVLAVVATLALAALAASPAGSADGLGPRTALPAVERAIPPQGLYEGCAPRVGLGACVERLGVIDNAGFELVLNYSAWYGSPAEVLGYADAAAALGLKLIWPLNHPAWRSAAGLAATYPGFADGSEPGNEAFIATAIALVAQHPATWGFYVGDEVPAAEAGAVARLSATVRLLAPDRPQLYVARPGAARLAPFASFVNVAGVTAYPLGSGDPPVRRAACRRWPTPPAHSPRWSCRRSPGRSTGRSPHRRAIPAHATCARCGTRRSATAARR